MIANSFHRTYFRLSSAPPPPYFPSASQTRTPPDDDPLLAGGVRRIQSHTTYPYNHIQIDSIHPSIHSKKTKRKGKNKEHRSRYPIDIDRWISDIHRSINKRSVILSIATEWNGRQNPTNERRTDTNHDDVDDDQDLCRARADEDDDASHRCSSSGARARRAKGTPGDLSSATKTDDDEACESS